MLGVARQPLPPASALRHLARTRSRERWVRMALWGWCTVIVIWLLPVGRWTATGLAPSVTIGMGGGLAIGGAVLVLLHRAAIRTESIRAAMSGTSRLSARVQDRQMVAEAPPTAARVLRGIALVAAVLAVLLAAPILQRLDVRGFDADAAWLLHPLATVLLAARWRWRGALVGLVMSLGILCIVEGWWEGWADVDTPDSRSMLAMSVLLTVVNPLAIMVLVRRQPGADDTGRLTAEQPRPDERAKRRRQVKDERLRALLQNASDVMMILDADATRRDVSSSVVQVLGYHPGELVDASFLALIQPDDQARVLSFHLECLSRSGVSSPIEFRCRHHDGTWRHVEAIFNNLLADPSVGGIVVSVRDITERKQYEEQLERQAFSDALTGLPNRALFMNRLTQALAAARREQRTVAVLFVDLDRFKVINDSLGHGAGDALLVGVAQRLATCVRPGDTAARFGGDEFALLLEDIDSPADATRVAERFVAALRQPFILDGHEVFTAASIGIALSTPTQTRPDEVLRNADVALYRAKGAGSRRFVLFDPSMSAQAVERLELEADLRRAMEWGELRLHYQPEVDLRTGAIIGVEALIRWDHPRRGLLTPADFLPLAEETGLIVPIGQWVLEEACRQAQAWPARRPGGTPFIMSVNVSAGQFGQPDLVQQVAHILEGTGLDPARLRLEITEGVVMEETESAIGALHALKALGVRLAIDDFGTGYSSLSYLTRFPVDDLKLDSSFVQRLDADERIGAIVTAVTTLARALGMEVTAEGIETSEQLARVAAVHCDRGQGYYFSQPVPAESLTVILQTDRWWTTPYELLV